MSKKEPTEQYMRMKLHSQKWPSKSSQKLHSTYCALVKAPKTKHTKIHIMVFHSME